VQVIKGDLLSKGDGKFVCELHILTILFCCPNDLAILCLYANVMFISL